MYKRYVSNFLKCSTRTSNVIINNNRTHNERANRFYGKQLENVFEVNGEITSEKHEIDELHFNEPDESHLEVLKTNFGHDSFKKSQWQAVQLVLRSYDTFLCLPTGYGKSLCYQYPAVYSNGLTIVISPLISLMQDQRNNIAACFIAYIQSEKEKMIQELINGHYNILYITPEFATNYTGFKMLKNIYKNRKITLFAIDEAHCILHWGKDFRQSYAQLARLRKYFPTVPIAALTATASNAEKEEIVSALNMINTQIVQENYDRPNLYFMVKPMSGKPIEDIVNIINSETHDINIDQGSVIVYCLTKKSAEKLAVLLRTAGLSAEFYHSQLSREERTSVLNNFLNNKTNIVVATTAFGMGINKPDVRAVIHYGASLNIEGYYHEIGRAGRDGKPALCVLFYSSADFAVHRYLNGVNTTSADLLKSKQESNHLMKRYVNLNSCRRQFLSSYFDVTVTTNEEFCCDNCMSREEHEMYECSSEVEYLLKAIRSFLPKLYGIKVIISLLIGVKHKHIYEICQGNKYYGLGNTKTENWWRSLALHLETEKFISQTIQINNNILYSKIVVEPKGMQWLYRKEKKQTLPIFFKINDT